MFSILYIKHISSRDQISSYDVILNSLAVLGKKHACNSVNHAWYFWCFLLFKIAF